MRSDITITGVIARGARPARLQNYRRRNCVSSGRKAAAASCWRWFAITYVSARRINVQTTATASRGEPALEQAAHWLTNLARPTVVALSGLMLVVMVPSLLIGVLALVSPLIGQLLSIALPAVFIPVVFASFYANALDVFGTITPDDAA